MEYLMRQRMNLFTALMLSSKKQAVTFVVEPLPLLASKKTHQLKVTQISEVEYLFEVFAISYPTEDYSNPLNKPVVSEKAHLSKRFVTTFPIISEAKTSLQNFLVLHGFGFDDWQPVEE